MPKDLPVRVKTPPSVRIRRESASSNLATHQANSERSLHSVIKSVMFAFGDVRNPQDNTADTVEKILQDQMHLAYRLAWENCQQRGTSVVEVLDVVFLYRRDIPLLHRLYRRLSTRSQVRQLQQQLGAKMGASDGEKTLQELRYSFRLIDDPRLNEVLEESYIDAISQERLWRMDVRTRGMDRQEYLEFHAARGVSFGTSGPARRAFLEWLSQNVLWQLSPSAGDVLAFIAYEIVAKLTESAVAIRDTAKAINEEELQEVGRGRRYNPDFVSNNPLFRGKFREDPVPSGQLVDGPAIQPKDIYEALRRLQAFREPPLFAHNKEMADCLWLI
ncbi:SAGA complex subunit spt3-like isoform X2 [Varroa jacobsoni]|uniref:Uncharacterized protein n=1 Tax=Varroa destructor TaxID=109461 RepID=A0A7M7KZ96_VARDE|nr:SAGA complex subunit spt3-like isoform X2 [Varroa destructor]XP_022701424.1 SAGA complex subunit spt3-like isoform X2 [Varroa jacobsoni]